MTQKRLSFIIAILILMVGCGQSTKGESLHLNKNPYSKTEFMLGTVVTIKIYDEDKKNVLQSAFDRIQILDEQISAEKIDSQINKINQNAGKKPVKVSKDVYQLIKSGKSHSQLSDGLFDISIGPLTKLWHIGFPDARKPQQYEIDNILTLINYKNIKLDDKNQTVFLTTKNMGLDLGAIAKGFITDKVVTVLREFGDRKSTRL